MALSEHDTHTIKTILTARHAASAPSGRVHTWRAWTMSRVWSKDLGMISAPSETRSPLRHSRLRLGWCQGRSQPCGGRGTQPSGAALSWSSGVCQAAWRRQEGRHSQRGRGRWPTRRWCPRWAPGRRKPLDEAGALRQGGSAPLRTPRAPLVVPGNLPAGLSPPVEERDACQALERLAPRRVRDT